MNKQLLIGFGVVLAIGLVFPIVAATLKQYRMATAPAPQAAPGAPKPACDPGSTPPLLTEANMIGSVWEVEPQKGIKVQVTLNPGGQAVAHSDNMLVKMMAGTDTLSGSWSVSGTKMHVSTNFQGKDVATDLNIVGDKVYDPKTCMQATRLR
jgi:hypothetical protein